MFHSTHTANGNSEAAASLHQFWALFQLTRQDNRGIAWRRFGEALEEAGRERAALAAYCRAMARDPVDFPARHRAVALLQQQGEPQAAKAIYRELLTINPHDASARLPWPERAGELQPVAAGSIAGAFLARVTALAPAGARVLVDKMPEQFLQIRLIAATMQQARIIHMTRDPRDVGVSCYTVRFHDGLAWSFELEPIARRQASYEAVMAHWLSVLPRGCMLEVPYEELVHQPKAWTACVLEFLGLTWQPACVHRHQETENPVRTSSVAQVREPISRSSVGRWQRFGDSPLGQPVVDGAASVNTCHQ